MEKKKSIRKRKELPVVDSPEDEDRTVSAYYMLAQVVEHNTMMMKAFIDMILAKEARLEAEEPTEETPKEKPQVIDDEKLKSILQRVYECAGKDEAMKLLAHHDADRVSKVAAHLREPFVECGLQIIKQRKGDIDERQ